jgi:hypothetical protein
MNRENLEKKDGARKSNIVRKTTDTVGELTTRDAEGEDYVDAFRAAVVIQPPQLPAVVVVEPVAVVTVVIAQPWRDPLACAPIGMSVPGTVIPIWPWAPGITVVCMVVPPTVVVEVETPPGSVHTVVLPDVVQAGELENKPVMAFQICPTMPTSSSPPPTVSISE